MNATFNKLWEESKHPLKEVSNSGEAIDFLLIGVDSKYIGQKIGSKLCELSFKLAQEKGFQYSFAFIMNERTQHLFEKEGCITLAKVDPSTYETYEL